MKEAVRDIARRSGSRDRAVLGQMIKNVKSEFSIVDEIDRLLAHFQQQVRALGISPESDHPSIIESPTGGLVLEMAPEIAEQIRQESYVQLCSDAVLSLIEPMEQQPPHQLSSVSPTWHLDVIGLEAARKRGFKGTGKGVNIAVVDTGIDGTHPDLKSKLIRNAKLTDDGRTTLVTSDAEDTNGHGTSVAGLIVSDAFGVAPGANLTSYNTLPSGQGKLTDFVLALNAIARDSAIDIVNISAGLPGYWSEMERAVENLRALGLMAVVATGNSGRNTSCSPGNLRGVLSVGASDRHEKVSSFSGSASLECRSHYYDVPDLVAPGEGVTTLERGGGYVQAGGSSFAAPIVSGIAALILEQRQTMNMFDLYEALIEGSTDALAPTSARRQGAGRVNVSVAERLAGESGESDADGAKTPRPTIGRPSRAKKKSAAKKTSARSGGRAKKTSARRGDTSGRRSD